jgi:hypothetical protein
MNCPDHPDKCPVSSTCNHHDMAEHCSLFRDKLQSEIEAYLEAKKDKPKET